MCLAQCREAFSAMLSERQAAEAAEAPKEEGAVEVARQADDLLVVRQLRGRGAPTLPLPLPLPLTLNP